MAEVKVYAKLIRGEGEHISAAARKEAPCILFSPHIEVDGHSIKTEHPDTAAWRAAGYPDDSRPEDAWPQPTLSVGEGFLILNVQHATDETWAYLSKLPDDEFGEGSTRESFDVLVTNFEYIQLEPGEGDPWLPDGPPRPSKLADLDRSVA